LRGAGRRLERPGDAPGRKRAGEAAWPPPQGLPGRSGACDVRTDAPGGRFLPPSHWAAPPGLAARSGLRVTPWGQGPGQGSRPRGAGAETRHHRRTWLCVTRRGAIGPVHARSAAKSCGDNLREPTPG